MDQFRVGQHEEAIRTLQTEVAGLRDDTRKILTILSKQEGERKAAIAFAGVLGAALSMFFKVILAKIGFHA